MATITLAVTVSNPGSGNRYYIDGALQATVSASVDNIYKFDQSDSSNSGHPLRLSTTSNGSHNSGSEYTTGVTTSGTPGSSGAYTQISVTALTVQSLYYYCTAHSGMGGSFNVGSSSLSLKETTGISVLSLSADPVPYAQEIANNPYAGAWSSGGNLNSGRYDLRGTGIQTAALAIGGYIPGGGNNVGVVESYNGTSWSEVADITARKLAGTAGTQTAALAFGGTGATGIVAITESWNGSGWTEVADLNTVRNSPGSAGIVTAALTFGGAGTTNGYTESWNGTSWTEVGDLNTARNSGAGFGANNTASIYCGEGTTVNGITESWNGTAWSEVADLNTSRRQFGPGATGSSTSGLVFGGETPGAANVANVETFNGTSWSSFANLSVARRGGIGAGASTASGLFSGGNGDNDATEEYTSPKIAVKTVDID